MNADGFDLVELHRQLAALVNPQCHWDLMNFPEVERRAAIAGALEQIESERSSAQILEDFRDGNFGTGTTD